MISPIRLKEIKNRLKILYIIFTQRQYPVFVKPTHYMSIDQIRERDHYAMENTVPDTDYYERPSCRNLRIIDIADIMLNVTENDPLYFDNSHKNVVEIYENIQEYGALWYELKITGSGYCLIDIDEIKQLENISMHIYDTYKDIKSYQFNKELRTQYSQPTKGNSDEDILQFLGVLGLPSNATRNDGVVPGFTSYYDLLKSDYNPFENIEKAAVHFNDRGKDSLFRLEQARETYGVWGK